MGVFQCQAASQKLASGVSVRTFPAVGPPGYRAELSVLAGVCATTGQRRWRDTNARVKVRREPIETLAALKCCLEASGTTTPDCSATRLSIARARPRLATLPYAHEPPPQLAP